MYRAYTAAETESILRASEDRPTMFRGGRTGHMGARHLLLSNADLLKRYTEEFGDRDYALVTAFTSLADVVAAATAILNARQTQAALEEFFVNVPRGPGMRATIDLIAARDFIMRYAMGAHTVATMPVRSLKMVLDRVDGRPFDLHIHTMYGLVPLGAARNEARVTNAEGRNPRVHRG
jgi:hypothetical protein